MLGLDIYFNCDYSSVEILLCARTLRRELLKPADKKSKMRILFSEVTFVYFLSISPLLTLARGIVDRKAIDKQNDLFPLSLIHINDFHAR